MQWNLINKKKCLETPPFKVEELLLKDLYKKDEEYTYYRLNCPDWVNILPVTKEGSVLLIKQSRVGSFSDILEIPGGVLDPSEKDPSIAAARELEEETGYTSNTFIHLASINPNPAINNNKLHMFLARDCILNTKRKHFPDKNERISVVETGADELDSLIRQGKINSCLAALTVMLALKYIKLEKGG